MNQPQAKILVGDPHQQIYAFRGAVNAMSRVQSTTIFYLTQVNNISFSSKCKMVTGISREWYFHEFMYNKQDFMNKVTLFQNAIYIHDIVYLEQFIKCFD